MTIVTAMFCAAAFAGYAAYERATMTDAERMMLANIEALTSSSESNNCPGGSCTTTYADGTECKACCSAGQSAMCDNFGCHCI